MILKKLTVEELNKLKALELMETHVLQKKR